MNTDSKANRLIHSSSPYLLQHAYNPVDWFPWGEEALTKAKQEDKPIIISIGYAACHWCHVMEKESFENDRIAAIMNDHFVCIKVDREERPDVDAIYMDAITIMGQRGGWPLNAFLTPDAKPFYAGTYFPPQNWIQLIENIADVFKKQRDELEKSAEGFKNSIAVSEIQKYGLHPESGEFKIEDARQMFEKLSVDFDTQKGGIKKAPKFPMPSIYFFLLNYYSISKQEQALQHLVLSLEEIAKGGIYDQIGGGFARYSVDENWLVPHFEKMLYDNAQLIDLYTQAYQLTQNPLFKKVVYETIAFIKRELMSKESGFFSALDADSEGEEGKFYCWEANELKEILGDEEALFAKYYQVKEEGNWEEKKNILHCKMSDADFAKANNLSLSELEEKVVGWKSTLLAARGNRIRPGLDDKILASWNAMMLKALVEAYRVFGENDFLDLALQNAHFIKEKFINQDAIFHSYKNGQSNIQGFLEDYAFTIEAFIAVYQATFDISWLKEAEKLNKYALQNFYDSQEEMFFFTDIHSENLIARKKEIFDNVIPASNSVMAKNLYFLGIFFDNNVYVEMSKKMLGRIKKVLLVNVEYLANWGSLYCLMTEPTAEVVIVGKQYKEFGKEIDQKFYPNKVLIASETTSDELPLLESRSDKEGKTMIYICYGKTCRLPVDNVKAAFELLGK